jgi:magnesium transporter
VIAVVCTRASTDQALQVRSDADADADANSDIVIDPRSHELVWIDVLDPNEADVAFLERTFGFHHLALEDIMRRGQRPKMDEYADYYFGVLYAVDPDVAARQMVANELHFFWGERFLVTVHARPLTEIEELARRARDAALAPTIGGAERGLKSVDLVYRLLDGIVDNYFVAVDALAEWGEELEDRMFAGRTGSHTLRDIFALKKILFSARKVIAPSRDVVNVILRRDLPMVPDPYVPYLQDVYDHTVRVIDSLDTYRDLMSSALDANLSLVSNEVGQTVKTMTALTAILMFDALIAGIYGMNFDVIPELHWQFGYAWAIGFMLASSLLLFAVFRRIRWL